MKQTIKTYRSFYRELLFDIIHLYRPWVIVGNSGTPFWKGECYIFQLLLLRFNSHHWWLYLLISDGIPCSDFYFQHKFKKQHRRGTIWNTGCEYWTWERFEVQANCWERYFLCFKATGTLVTRIICYCNQSVPAW